MKKIILPALLCVQGFLFAQTDYIEHRVSKGETLYQISRNYNVKLGQIYMLNPSLTEHIEIDQVILIPNSATQSSGKVFAQEDNDFVYHIVESGETKFGLQRKYNVPMYIIEEDNPHIIEMLQAGQKVRIRKSLTKDIGVLKESSTHTVTKGETLTSIASMYGVKLADLVSANKDNLREFLQIGQVLRIPSDTKTKTPNNQVTSSNKVHLVKQGETKFGIARMYNTTVSALEELNPHIVKMLKEGHTLVLPNSVSEVVEENNYVETNYAEPSLDETHSIESSTSIDEVAIEEEKGQVVEEAVEAVESNVSDTAVSTVVEEQEVDASDWVDYEVQPRETVFGLAKKAGVSQAQFLQINPILADGVQIGAIIKMPSSGVAPTQSVASSWKQASEGGMVNIAKTITKETKKIVFSLPVVKDDLMGLKNNQLQGEDKIQSAEFLSGALIAIDSINKLGATIDYSFINPNQLTVEQINEASVDMIIGMGSGKDEVLQVDKPFVYPFTNSASVNVSNYYRALPSKEYEIGQLMQYVLQQQGNVLVISDIEKAENKEYIARNIPEARFVKINDNVNPDIQNFKSLLNKNAKNFVVLDTDRLSLFLNVTNMLLHEITDYELQMVLVEKSKFIEKQDISPIRLALLKTMYPSLSTHQDDKKGAFYKKYHKDYKKLPSEQAVRGFEVTYDALLRLLQNQGFKESVKDQITKQGRQRFEYKQNKDGIYQNISTYILYYNTGTDIRLVK
ncbi:MAG: LysM peptidoglycan-binding domain-containing protein [Bacteroidota bacterium]|nr:LysM peptidoglycan-binding domain-containing protein [Bacteroidota bacterium]